jgi:hypothetical protein
MSFDPHKHIYDYNLGIGSEYVNYIKESHVVQSRISPTPCYLLFLNTEGVSIGSEDYELEVVEYSETSPRYRTVIWNHEKEHPDLRLKTETDLDTITVLIDGVRATRIPEIEDLENDNEYVIIKRVDLESGRVELVFNEGFNASLHDIKYYYYTVKEGIDPVRVKEGEDTTHSMYGWTQYINDRKDAFQDYHQILVRLPLTIRDLTINEEGLVILEERQSWMIWEPYVKEQDVLIIPKEFSTTGKEERFEIVEKQDSIIQRILVSQRFKLKHLEYHDPRYQIRYITKPSDEELTDVGSRVVDDFDLILTDDYLLELTQDL